jgi:hypothetical protein
MNLHNEAPSVLVENFGSKCGALPCSSVSAAIFLATSTASHFELRALLLVSRTVAILLIFSRTGSHAWQRLLMGGIEAIASKTF